MCAILGVIWGLPAMEDEGSALFCLLPPSHTLPHTYYPPPILLTYCPFWFNKLFFFFVIMEIFTVGHVLSFDPVGLLLQLCVLSRLYVHLPGSCASQAGCAF